MTAHPFGYWSLQLFSHEEADLIHFVPNTYFAEINPNCNGGTGAKCPSQIYSEERFLGVFTTVDAALAEARKHLNP